jgi:hypothetical protein
MSDHVLIMRGVSDAKPVQRSAKSSSSARWRRPESWEYRLLYGATFMVFLVAACIETLDPRRMIRKDSDGAQKTIIQRASLGARTCVAYAFMG